MFTVNELPIIRSLCYAQGFLQGGANIISFQKEMYGVKSMVSTSDKYSKLEETILSVHISSIFKYNLTLS